MMRLVQQKNCCNTSASCFEALTKYDKTSKSKDVIIAAKDKRIAKLEEENRRLQNEVNNLMAKLYEK